ncbi:MAG: nicotinamide riboside transporter PnuC [Pseudomonadota bacterium]
MTETQVIHPLIEAWAAQSKWELLAVVLAVVYLLLVIRQNAWCWVAALISTAIYSVLFWDVQLVMQSALNGFYLMMAVYGWWYWRFGHRSGDDPPSTLPIVRWPWRRHVLVLIMIGLATLIAGGLLTQQGDANRPFLDALIAWSAVATTFMVARKVLENWLYWWIINSLAVGLYYEQGLLLTALLHALYLLLALFGWRQWLRDYRAQRTQRVASSD